MKKWSKIILTLLAISLAAFSCSTLQQEDKPKKQYTITQFMDIVQIGGGAFSPDDSKILINSKETGIFNAFEIDLKSGEKKQLTSSTGNAIFSQSYFPGDDRVVYTSDNSGNEITHIYVRNTNGSTIDLIQDSTAKAQFRGWSYNRKNMYYASNSRDKRYFDLLRVQVEGTPKEGNLYPASMVYQNNEGLDVATISNDDRYIALTKTITTNNSDMYLLDTQSKKMKHLSPHQGNAQYAPQYFSLDGKTLYYLTDEGSEYMYLAGYDVASGEKKKVEEVSWDIMDAYLSRNGKYRVVAINNDARTEIKIYDETNGGQPVKIDGLPEGDITGVNISDSES